jgi:hypothetical protein
MAKCEADGAKSTSNEAMKTCYSPKRRIRSGSPRREPPRQRSPVDTAPGTKMKATRPAMTRRDGAAGLGGNSRAVNPCPSELATLVREAYAPVVELQTMRGWLPQSRSRAL